MKVYVVLSCYLHESEVVLVTSDKLKAESYLSYGEHYVEELEMDKERDESESCS